jgi:hypothetical protein
MEVLLADEAGCKTSAFIRGLPAGVHPRPVSLFLIPSRLCESLYLLRSFQVPLSSMGRISDKLILMNVICDFRLKDHFA